MGRAWRRSKDEYRWGQEDIIRRPLFFYQLKISYCVDTEIYLSYFSLLLNNISHPNWNIVYLYVCILTISDTCFLCKRGLERLYSSPSSFKVRVFHVTLRYTLSAYHNKQRRSRDYLNLAYHKANFHSPYQPYFSGTWLNSSVCIERRC